MKISKNENKLFGSEVFWLVLSFLIGVNLMALEIVGIRILAPYFGYSIYVSGSLIGVVLSAMSIGYFIGGILSTKDKIKILQRVAFISTISYIILIQSYHRILGFFARYGELYGSLLASLILFAPLMLLLSTISPLIVSIISKKGKEGIAASRIFAVSTIGSVTGVFLTTFVFIPTFGSRSVLNICFIMLLIITIILFSGRKITMLFLLSTVFLIFTIPDKHEDSLFFKESAYNQIQVIQRDGTNFLIMNNPKYFQSMYNPTMVFTNQYFDVFNAAPLLSRRNVSRYDPINILILGMCAGTSIHQFRHFYPNSEIDAVDIDPAVIDVGKQYFGLDNLTNVNMVAIDGRSFVKHADKIYDIVEIDVYEGGSYPPFYVMTKEFYQELYQITQEDGILTINIELSNTNSDAAKLYLDTIVKTIYSSFSSVYGIKYKENVILFASKKIITPNQLKATLSKYAKEDQFYELAPIIGYMVKNVQNMDEKEVPVLTDDLAPVERYKYNLFT